MFQPWPLNFCENHCQRPVAGTIFHPSFIDDAYATGKRLPLLHFMNPLCINLRQPLLRCASPLSCSTFKIFSAADSTLSTTEAQPAQESSVSVIRERPIRENNRRKKANDEVLYAQLKENWLASIACPYRQKINSDEGILNCDLNGVTNVASEWVLGIDPDVSGAVALLKPDNSVQVFDSPHLKVPVGGRTRKRLDAKSTVQLLSSFDAPMGTTAYLEQSIPYPKDGKQGWWSSGYAYGLWIGVLVASGFSVIPVPSIVWKNEFKLLGKHFCKDDSREVASIIFPSMSSLLKRKKDHGRAEALLIAAYGKGQKLDSNSLCLANKELLITGGF